MGKRINIDNITYGGGDLPIIAGPCVIESRDHSLSMAESIRKITDQLDVPFIFKSSFLAHCFHPNFQGGSYLFSYGYIHFLKNVKNDNPCV